MAQLAPDPLAAPAPTSAPILRASGIRKTFKMGDARIEVLKGVDVEIRPGEFVAIEGRSGSGKSTLLHILGALDSADGGTVEFEGRNIQSLGGAARSRLRNARFGFVFQFYHLLPELNVLENTMLAPMVQHSWLGFRSRRRVARERAIHLLRQFGLDHRLRQRPTHLSGGERQRVAIARALMNQPQVLFADEPTGNLDAETGAQIMGVVNHLHRHFNQTIVLVTHDRALAREADRVLVLRDGRLEEVGGQESGVTGVTGVRGASSQ